MARSAFVGISLDSTLFSREWIRAALTHLLSGHDEVLLVLADQLLAYNKVALLPCSAGAIDLEGAKMKMDQRRDDISRFLAKEIALIPKAQRQRLRVTTWEDHSDAVYIGLLRKLRIAYSVIPEFRECVDYDAHAHFEKRSETAAEGKVRHELSVSYVLDETAMDIRITEFLGYPNEYYPEDHIRTLTQLYEGRFSASGLSVGQLIGRTPQRVFQPLRFAEAQVLPPDVGFD
jgi:tRNA-dependent cyclodipeptide synthase